MKDEYLIFIFQCGVRAGLEEARRVNSSDVANTSIQALDSIRKETSEHYMSLSYCTVPPLRLKAHVP